MYLYKCTSTVQYTSASTRQHVQAFDINFSKILCYVLIFTYIYSPKIKMIQVLISDIYSDHL